MPDSELTDMTDRDLVCLTLLGCSPAFDALVIRYRDGALAVAIRTLGSPDLAEETVQDAFLGAYRSLAQLKDPSKFPGWLYAIVRNQTRRDALHERRRETFDLADIERLSLDRLVPVVEDPVELLVRHLEEQALDAAFGTLQEDHRAVLHLYYFEEWPVKRIADFLGLPVTTVKWRLHQGRLTLKNRLLLKERKRP